jgi:uroporphyrin-3 C-methyltransferase
LLYTRALTKASNAIDTWYDSSNPRIIALSVTLEELASQNIDPDLPDISRSLQLLKSRLAGRLNSDEGNTSDDPADSSEGDDA